MLCKDAPAQRLYFVWFRGTLPLPHVMSLPLRGVVLVVDDDPSIHRLLGRLLTAHGFTPLHAETLSQAIEMAERGGIDALILDLGLRGSQSGLDILRWLRARPRYADTPVLILTGSPSLSEDQEAAIEHHGARVFFKPQKMSLLIDYLKEALGHPPS